MKIVLVTGASYGIGASCATMLAARGFRVYGASRTGTCGAGVIAMAMDVTSDESVRAAVGTILEREGRIDAVVNNAGNGMAGAVEGTSVEEARQQFEVNFFGVLRVCRAVLPAMRQQRAGTIVNIGSIGGLIAIPYQGLYSASKFALEGLTEALRMEVKPFGIRTVLIEPGDHATAFTRNRQRTNNSLMESAYRDRADRAIARMARDEQSGPAPEGVARLVCRVLAAPNPRLRYTTGPIPQRAAVWLKRLLPYAVLERILHWYYSG